MAVLEVDFAELEDGSLVEVVEDPADATKTLLAVYKNQSVRYAESVEDRGRLLVPLSRTDHLQYVRLAEGAVAYGHLVDLRKKVILFLSTCLDLNDDLLCLMAAFALSSWFTEKLSVAPYLALVGPPGSGKTTAMQALGLLCYRGLLTADISSSAFYDISDRFRPTVLLDETLTAGHSRELIHLLKLTSTRGFVYLRKGQARLAFGPKVFAWLELPNDAALNSRCLLVPMHKTSRTDLQSLSDPVVLERAKKIRTQLLQFRFERLRNVSLPKVPSNVQLSGRPLDLYRALALPFDQDLDMVNFLGPAMAAQKWCQARLLSPAQTSTIRVLDTYIHNKPDVPGLMMHGLTAAVNSDLAVRGEPLRLNERKLGDILTSLSFTSRTRRNTGYILWLDRSDRARIHATAGDYGVEGTHGGTIESCEICTKVSAPAATSAPGEVPTEKEVELKNPKGVGRERRERRSRSSRLRSRARGIG